MKKTLLLLALWQFGCAASSEFSRSSGCGWTPDPEIHGAHLDTDDCQSAVCKDPNLKARIKKTIEVSADYWGAPYDVLEGWKIRLIDNETSPGHNGHTNWLNMTIDVSVCPDCVGMGGWEIETSSLLHEVGHVVLPGGDIYHWDAKWYDDEDFLWAVRQFVGECVLTVPVITIDYYREQFPTWQIREDGCVLPSYEDWWDGY